MRFITGLIGGAALTLLVASTMDAPAADLLARSKGGWQALIRTTGESLFQFPDTKAAAPTANDTDALVALNATAANEPLTPLLPPDVEAPPPSAGAITTTDAAKPTTDAAPTATPEPFDALAVTPDPSPATPLAGALTPLAGVRSPFDQFATGLATTDGILALEPVGAGSEPVWVPFHSEMSASGFAQRLSQTLDHPFAVQRQGPGNYQVTFPYTSDGEREALLARIETATGLPR